MPPPIVVGFPVVTLPFEMVRPEIDTVLPALIAKIRKLGVPPWVLRCTVNAPAPLIVMSEAMFGRALVKSIVPETVKLIVSEPLLSPAAHSPAVAPETVLVLAAVMASCNVHSPSVLFATSAVLFTVIVLPAAGVKTPESATGRAGAK